MRMAGVRDTAKGVSKRSVTVSSPPPLSCPAWSYPIERSCTSPSMSRLCRPREGQSLIVIEAAVAVDEDAHRA